MRARSFALLIGMIWFVLLGCRTGDLVAQYQSNQATATRTVARASATARPTFTPLPPTISLPSLPTIAPAPTNAPLSLVPAPTLPPTATRTRAVQPTARPKAQPAAPTADLYQGYYYRITKNVCVTAPNTRAEGTVLNNGVPENGVIVRIANGNGGDPVIDDYVTGIDPQSNKKYTSPEWTGKYRLGVAEGQQMAGNWWVFIVNNKGEQISVGAYFNTHDSNGCNTAFIDFAH